MFTIHHQIGIKAKPEEVYLALSTAEGVSGWWSRAAGDFEAGGEFKMYFGDITASFQVLQQNPGKVAWQCLEADPQWQDTQIIFELKEADGQTFVNFKHECWSEESELYAHCTTKWAVFLLSLKSLVETGKGSPYPEDIQVNHS